MYTVMRWGAIPQSLHLLYEPTKETDMKKFAIYNDSTPEETPTLFKLTKKTDGGIEFNTT